MGIPDARVPKREKTPKTPKRGDPGGDRGNPKNQETGYQKGGKKGGPKPGIPKVTKPGKGGSRRIKGDRGGRGGTQGKPPKTPIPITKRGFLGYGNLGGTIPALKGALKGGKSKRKSGGAKMSKTPKPHFQPKLDHERS